MALLLYYNEHNENAASTNYVEALYISLNGFNTRSIRNDTLYGFTS